MSNKHAWIAAIVMVAVLALSSVPALASPRARDIASFAARAYCEMAGLDGPTRGHFSPVYEGDGEWSFSFFCTTIDADGNEQEHWFFDWTFTCLGCRV